MDGVDISGVLGKLSEDPEMMKRAAELAKSLMGDTATAGEKEVPRGAEETGAEEEKNDAVYLPAVRGKGADTVSLLKALRPYLNSSRQDKIDRIIKLMRVMDLGKLVRF